MGKQRSVRMPLPIPIFFRPRYQKLSPLQLLRKDIGGFFFLETDVFRRLNALPTLFLPVHSLRSARKTPNILGGGKLPTNGLPSYSLPARPLISILRSRK